MREESDQERAMGAPITASFAEIWSYIHLFWRWLYFLQNGRKHLNLLQKPHDFLWPQHDECRESKTHPWGWEILPKNMNNLVTQIQVLWVQLSYPHLSPLFLSLPYLTKAFNCFSCPNQAWNTASTIETSWLQANSQQPVNYFRLLFVLQLQSSKSIAKLVLTRLWKVILVVPVASGKQPQSVAKAPLNNMHLCLGLQTQSVRDLHAQHFWVVKKKQFIILISCPQSEDCQQCQKEPRNKKHSGAKGTQSYTIH